MWGSVTQGDPIDLLTIVHLAHNVSAIVCEGPFPEGHLEKANSKVANGKCGRAEEEHQMILLSNTVAAWHNVNPG